MESNDLKRFIYIPTLNSGKIKLRRILKTDIDDVYEYASDPATSEFLLWSPHPDRSYTKRYLDHLDKKYRRGEFYDWGIEFEGKMIGTCGFTSFSIENNSAEIGYVLNKNFWGKGIASKVARMVMEYGFIELGLNRIEAKYMVEYDSSRRVMEKCLMTSEGVLRSAIYSKNRYRDIGVYSILREEYFKFRSNGSI